MPDGLTSSTMIRMANTMASENAEVMMPARDGADIRLGQAFDQTDGQTTDHAPGMEPMPPSTAATNAFRPSMAPIIGETCG